jgi:uncharacterized Tic20 family protein
VWERKKDALKMANKLEKENVGFGITTTVYAIEETEYHPLQDNGDDSKDEDE